MIRRLLDRLLGSRAPGGTYRAWWDENASSVERAVAATVPAADEEEYRSRGWNGDTNSFGARQLIERAGLTAGSVVLEIGCGIARIGREMAPRVKEWHGADISPGMIRLARRRCEGIANVRFHELDSATGLGTLPHAAFEFVYSTIVLMHLDKEDVFRYLCDAHALVRTGGAAYFDTWNITHPDVFRIWQECTRPGEDKVRGRMQCCAPEEFRMYLGQAGFEVTWFDGTGRLVRAFCRKPAETPLPVEDDGFPPMGYMTSPRNEATVSGTVRIEGFALDRIVRVEVAVDGRALCDAAYGVPSPLAGAGFPRYQPVSANCGFRFDLDTTALADGAHCITITAFDANGASTVITGEYQGLVVKNSG
jgi:SAM-dependent methyltransferase